MHLARFLGCLLILAFLPDVAEALPSKCLQAVERKNACPHLIYKKAALDVPALDTVKGGIICICLTDLQALQQPSGSEVDKIDQQVTLERLAAKYQLNEQDIVTLLKN